MSTQAVEKLLKSYLLFRDHTLGGCAKKLKQAIEKRSRQSGRAGEWGHDVEAALSLAVDIGLPRSTELPRRLTRINSYYLRRYPDRGGPTSLSGSEINDVDEAVFEIWDSFRDINADFYFACGISRPVRSHFISPASVGSRGASILSSANHAFAKRKDAIEAGIRAIEEDDAAHFADWSAVQQSKG